MDEIELTDGIVAIRKYRDGDAELLYEAVRESIAEVSRWLPWCHEGYSIEESREFVATRNVRKATNGTASRSSISLPENSSAASASTSSIEFINAPILATGCALVPPVAA